VWWWGGGGDTTHRDRGGSWSCGPSGGSNGQSVMCAQQLLALLADVPTTFCLLSPQTRGMHGMPSSMLSSSLLRLPGAAETSQHAGIYKQNPP
jgi:hypothetical protein